MPVRKISRKPQVKLGAVEDSDSEEDYWRSTEPKIPLFPVKIQSASEIARNVAHFDVWSTHQGLERVTYDDVPLAFRDTVKSIFDYESRIPLEWIEETSEVRKHLGDLTPDFVKFMKKAHHACPSLFYDPGDSPDSVFPIKERQAAFANLHAVLLAWKRLKSMHAKRENWSESDYASNVYNVFRSPAVKKSAYRTNCGLALPKAYSLPKSSLPPHLNPKSTIPDCNMFVNPISIRDLSEPSKSPFKYLATNKSTFHPSSAAAAAFRIHATPCATLPDKARFDFLSSIWEDKKSSGEMFDAAYRQNRMGCASALRHLRTFGVDVPVFGLIWAQGKVRAHIDWHGEDYDDINCPRIYSTPYPNPRPKQSDFESSDSDSDSNLDYSLSDSYDFHEWNLLLPQDILQVYLIIRNLDTWTAGPFKDKAVSAVEELVRNVKKGKQLHAWKRDIDRALRPISINVKTAIRNASKENTRRVTE